MIRFFLLLSLALFLWAGTPDATVENRLRARLARSSLRSEPVRVRVVQGVAILEGSVSTPQRKGAATRLARSSGASSVENRLQVGTSAPEAPLKTFRVLPRPRK